MRRTKGFKISKIIYYLTVMFLCMGIVFLTSRLIRGEPVNMVEVIGFIGKGDLLLKDGKDMDPKDQLREDKGQEDREDSSLKGILWRLTPNSIKDPKRLFMYQMPFIRGFDQSPSRGDAADRQMPESDMKEEVKEVSGEIHETSDEVEPMLSEEPKIPDDIKIVIEKIEDDLGPIELSGEGPQILIYHSHSREAYMQEPERKYKEAAREAFRTDDLDSTVIRVGDVLTHHLKELGIPVLHDRTEHEQGNYNKSYVKSLETINRRMKEYDSLKIFIDIHRNAYKEGTRTPDQEVVVVDGERVAKMSVVIGTGKGQLGGFKEKPNWKENYKLALKLTNKVNELCPGLAKPVMVQSGRYNQHVSTNAILIEVGSNLTTLTEAERTAKYIAKALSKIVE